MDYTSRVWAKLMLVAQGESGQGATEYAVLTVLVIAAIAAITLGLTNALGTAYSAVADAITNAV